MGHAVFLMFCFCSPEANFRYTTIPQTLRKCTAHELVPKTKVFGSPFLQALATGDWATGERVQLHGGREPAGAGTQPGDVFTMQLHDFSILLPFWAIAPN